MVRIIYQQADGEALEVNASVGENIMQIAVDHGVDGILGRCGGFCQCGTCHVYVDTPWLETLGETSPEEDAMLEGVPVERLSNSRLGCQVRVSAAMDGMVITVPVCQE